MNKRQQLILYYLYESTEPRTSEELAKFTGVSSRTIKSEMRVIRNEISKMGALLSSRRNVGYFIQIVDKEIFQAMIKRIEIEGYFFDRRDINLDFLYIARKLVAISDRCIRTEDLEDELFISRNLLRSALKQAFDFLESYGLKIENRPKQGMQIKGQEYQIRMAMSELFFIHYHELKIENVGSEYYRWISAGEEERQEIRHIFLEELRKSPIRMGDLYTQRIAVYLVIARNRIREGMIIKSLPGWKEQISSIREYDLAENVCRALEHHFPDFLLSEEEVTFIAVIFALFRDLGKNETVEEQYPAFSEEVVSCRNAAWKRLGEENHINFSSIQEAKEDLDRLLFPLVFAHHFGFDGMEMFDYISESEEVNSPVTFEIGREISMYIAEYSGIRFSTRNIHILAHYIRKVCSKTEYDIKKMKLLVVNHIGLRYADDVGERLMKMYPKEIESCTSMELYEGRAYRAEDYDGVILDIAEFSYKYQWQHCILHTIPLKQEYNDIYNKLLVHAYQFEQYLLKPEQIAIYKDFLFSSPRQFFQFMSYRQGESAGEQEIVQKGYETKERFCKYHLSGEVLFLFDKASERQPEFLNVYILSQTGMWHENEIRYIFHMRIDWKQDLKKLKTYENIFHQIGMNGLERKKLENEISLVAYFHDLMVRCLKYE